MSDGIWNNLNRKINVNNIAQMSGNSDLLINRHRLYSEFNENKIGSVTLQIQLNDLIKELIQIKTLPNQEKIIKNAVKIQANNYDLLVKYLDGDMKLAAGNDLSFDIQRGDTRIAGWATQGNYSMVGAENSYYSSENHWGTWVSSEFKGTGLGDLLYNLKSLVDDQPEFEHVDGKSYAFLTFYIKKGYTPYSIIKYPKLDEHFLTEVELNNLANHLLSQRAKKASTTKKNEDPLAIDSCQSYTLKLKLDPLLSADFYKKIKSSAT